MLQKFKYAAPTARAELLGLLAEHKGKAKLLAGGTDLLVNIRGGVMKPELVINVKKVQGYSGITWSQSEGLVMRAATTINEVLRDKNVRDLSRFFWNARTTSPPIRSATEPR
jgi:carbon-monoxide dehydrogenase medium subunit